MSAVHTKKPDTAWAAGVMRKIGLSSVSSCSSGSHDMLGPAGAAVGPRLGAMARRGVSSPSLSGSGTSRFHICQRHGRRSVSDRSINIVKTRGGQTLGIVGSRWVLNYEKKGATAAAEGCVLGRYFILGQHIIRYIKKQSIWLGFIYRFSALHERPYWHWMNGWNTAFP